MRSDKNDGDRRTSFSNLLANPAQLLLWRACKQSESATPSQLQCCMPINVAENRKMVTTNFGPEVEILPFLPFGTFCAYARKNDPKCGKWPPTAKYPSLTYEIGVGEFNGFDAISVAHQKVGGPGNFMRGPGNFIVPPPFNFYFNSCFFFCYPLSTIIIFLFKNHWPLISLCISLPLE